MMREGARERVLHCTIEAFGSDVGRLSHTVTLLPYICLGGFWFFRLMVKMRQAQEAQHLTGGSVLAVQQAEAQEA